MNPITRMEIYGIIALILGFAIGGSYFYGHHKGYVEGQGVVQVKFDAFINETKAAGLKAESDKQAKEKADNEKVIAAVASRDVALNQLHIAQARPRSGFVSQPPAGSATGDRVCYSAKALDAALRGLDTGVSGLLAEGDGQVINSLTLLRAWPGSVK